jgi:hypothetical protein
MTTLQILTAARELLSDEARLKVMVEAVAPFPEHLVAEHPDPDDPWHRMMQAATITDQMVARSSFQTMIDAAIEKARADG